MEFLASMVDPSKEIELTPDDVLVVRDYVSVFPIDLPGLPPVTPQILYIVKACIIMHNIMKWNSSHNYGIQLGHLCTFLITKHDF